MSQHSFYWIDAFTEKAFGGNPCAVVMDADSLSAEKMLVIAREMNLSETAFVMSSSKAAFGARYFTPEGELPFAGHPTIATVHALIQSGHLKLSDKKQSITLELPAGVIPIEIDSTIKETRITMSQLPPQFLRTYDPAEVIQIYGLALGDLLPGALIQTVSTGTPILMIPLVNHAALRKVRNADFKRYERLREKGDFFFPHHFCIGGATPQGATFARSLGTDIHPLEDPFTGSATGCMAAYLWKYRLISQTKFIAEQGHWMGRPGAAQVEIVGSSDAIETVRISGSAVTIVMGTFLS